MKVVFAESFARDLERVRNKRVLSQMKDLIRAVRAASSPGDLALLKPLRRYESFYRIRVGQYRVGIEIVKRKISFVRLVHRRDLYRYFP